MICVDIQEKMIGTLKKRAAKAGLGERITTVVASGDSLHLDAYEGAADFASAFAVAHEVPDQAGLFAQVHRAMKPGSLLLLSEPKGHVTEEGFQKTIELARASGFTLEGSPDIKHALSRILKKK